MDIRASEILAFLGNLQENFLEIYLQPTELLIFFFGYIPFDNDLLVQIPAR